MFRKISPQRLFNNLSSRPVLPPPLIIACHSKKFRFYQLKSYGQLAEFSRTKQCCGVNSNPDLPMKIKSDWKSDCRSGIYTSQCIIMEQFRGNRREKYFSLEKNPWSNTLDFFNFWPKIRTSSICSKFQSQIIFEDADFKSAARTRNISKTL